MLMKLFNKGQVVIPAEIRREMGLHVGDFLDVRIDRQKHVIELTVPEPTLSKSLAGSLSRYKHRFPSRKEMYSALEKGLSGESESD